MGDAVHPKHHPERIERDLGRIATDGLRPALFAITVSFAAMAVYVALEMPPGVRVPVVIYDLVLSVAGLALHRLCRKVTLSPARVHKVVAALSLGIAGDILLVALLNENPLYTFCIGILTIASASAVLSAGWAVGIVVMELATWAVAAYVLMPRSALAANALVMGTCVAVAALVHATRQVATRKILELRAVDAELRAGDARRELALQEALDQADEARRGLDRKVEERTAALRSELEERGRLEEQLRHARKLEAVGRLAGGIAHDFNNLLTVIRMSLLTVAEPGVPGDDVRDALRDASDATDRAAGLTHDLLAFARKQTLQRKTIAMADIIGGVERMVRRVAEASIRIEVRIAPEVGDVIADRHQIEQVLLNLAINACDAMGNRGTLCVAVDAVELDAPDAARHRLAPGCYVRVAVSDTGTGMDEATRRSAFEPFFTTKEVGRGTGLGLAVAHGIVTQHGGEITIESVLGQGSTFSVFLPHAGGAAPRRIAAAAKPLASLGHETLLVVEDEPAVRRAVVRNLERLGYRVLAAHDGEDALRITASLDGIDLVVSDVVMPGIDGPELACRLRDRWSDLSVLFVTGYSADRLARSGAVRPHDCVLEKPYQLEELTRTIREMLATSALRSAAARA